MSDESVGMREKEFRKSRIPKSPSPTTPYQKADSTTSLPRMTQYFLNSVMREENSDDKQSDKRNDYIGPESQLEHRGISEPFSSSNNSKQQGNTFSQSIGFKKVDSEVGGALSKSNNNSDDKKNEITTRNFMTFRKLTEKRISNQLISDHRIEIKKTNEFHSERTVAKKDNSIWKSDSKAQSPYTKPYATTIKSPLGSDRFIRSRNG